MPERLSSLRLPDMPNDDQSAYYWLMNFAEALAREHEAGGLGLSRELSETISQRVKAYDVACRPDTRTSIAVAV